MRINKGLRIYIRLIVMVLIVFVGALTIIASAPNRIWVKPGSTQQDYNKDSYECEKDARQSGYYGTGITRDIEMQNFFSRCMVSKGWSLQESQGR
jgi:hypothetical protein